MNMESSNTATDVYSSRTINDLRSNGPLWWRIHVFTFDLRNFRGRKDSLDRLDKIADPSYIGKPYFSDSEALQIKETLIDESGKTLAQMLEETLEERLNRRMKKRVESGDYRVCAAHDLAPVFEVAFGIRHKVLAKDWEFVDMVGEKGLKGGHGWTGLRSQPKCGPKISPGKKKKKRRG